MKPNAKSESGTDIQKDLNQNIHNNNHQNHNHNHEEIRNKSMDQYSQKNTDAISQSQKSSNRLISEGSKSKKDPSIRILKKKLNDSSINTNESYDQSHLDPNKYKGIVYPVSNSNINIKNYRMDNFKHLRDKLDKVRLSSMEKKMNNFDEIFKHNNKEKNTNVINEINSLLVNIDNIKTKNSFSPDIKDSLLNSYKDFIAVNRQTKFYEGASILDLKKDFFVKKFKIFDVKVIFIF